MLFLLAGAPTDNKIFLDTRFTQKHVIIQQFTMCGESQYFLVTYFMSADFYDIHFS